MKKLLLVILCIHVGCYSTMPDDLVLERTGLRNSYERKKLEYAEKFLTFNAQLKPNFLKESIKPLVSSLYNFLKKTHNPEERCVATFASPKLQKKQMTKSEFTKSDLQRIKIALDYDLKKSESAMNFIILMDENILKLLMNQELQNLVNALQKYLIEFYTFDMNFKSYINIKKINNQEKELENNILFVSTSISDFDQQAKNKEEIYNSIQSLIQHYQYNVSVNVL